MAAILGGSELGPLEASACVVSLEDEGVGGSSWVTEWQKLKAPKVCFLSKSRRFPGSGTRSGEQ
jgi:hypothetical protein